MNLEKKCRELPYDTSKQTALLAQLDALRAFGYEEHPFILNTYKNQEKGIGSSIEERVLLDPEHPERVIHLIATRGMGNTLQRFDNRISAQEYILSYMISKPEEQHLVYAASDTTQFCNAVAALGFTHDFGYGTDYIKYHDNGTATHIRELIEPTKQATELINIAAYESIDGVHRKASEATFHDHTKALDYVRRLMEERQ